MTQLFTILLLCNTLLIVGSFEANSQTGKRRIQSPTQIAVNRIDSIINMIQADTTLELVTIKEKQLVKRVVGNAFSKTVYGTYKNGQLLMVQSVNNGDRFFFSGNSKTVYFNKGEAILYIEQFNNSSRMGSCGNISVDFCHYLKDSVAFAGLAKSVTSFYDCYGYKLQQTGRAKLFAEIDQLKTLLSQQTKSNSQNKKLTTKGRYFFTCIPL